MSIEATEAAAAAVAVSPSTRVSLADIEENIAATIQLSGLRAAVMGHVNYAVHTEPGEPGHPIDHLKYLSITIIVLKNGFIVVGKSAPADPANFDAALGKKLSYEDAIRQIWPLMGYALRQKLMEQSNV